MTDVIGQPGALPLLQFTLAELFDRGSGDGLTLADYRELGGVGAAVARGAEDAYAGLGAPVARPRASSSCALVDLGDGGAVRRRVGRAELLDGAGDAPAAALEAFTARRLLSLDRDPETREPTVEIAHDALLGAWERLRGWIAAAEEDLRTQHRLAPGGARLGGRRPRPVVPAARRAPRAAGRLARGGPARPRRRSSAGCWRSR